MARISFGFADIHEMRNLNIATWDALRAVQRLISLQKDYGEDMLLTLEYKREKAHDQNFEATADFHRIDIGESISPDLPFEAPVVFTPPKDYNLEESFNWLFTEVTKLAYVASAGHIEPYGGISEGVSVPHKDVFAMEFRYCTEPDLGRF